MSEVWTFILIFPPFAFISPQFSPSNTHVVNLYQCALDQREPKDGTNSLWIFYFRLRQGKKRVRLSGLSGTNNTCKALSYYACHKVQTKLSRSYPYLSSLHPLKCLSLFYDNPFHFIFLSQSLLTFIFVLSALLKPFLKVLIDPIWKPSAYFRVHPSIFLSGFAINGSAYLD